MLRYLLSLFSIVVGCNALCYDRNTKQSYRLGQTYSKTKPLGHLMGTYDCECQERGRTYCTATDIPCKDFVTKQYVDKEERFSTLLRNRPYNCICRGGFGRFDSCSPGYLKRDRCRSITGEEVADGEYVIVRKYGNGMRCLCESGRELTSTCERVCLDYVTNELVQDGGLFTYISFGSLHTCTCASGLPRGCQLKKPELDPCIFGQDDCDRPRATCSSEGSRYTCTCKSGFEGNGRTCSDIDECSGDHGCDLNANCVNTEGTYTCTCKAGYSGDGRICMGQDVNPCDSNAIFCDVNARCEPIEESFVCICGEGYTGSGFECQDYDECNGDHGCDSNASCNNTIGSYLCFCNYGYSGDGRSCSQMCLDGNTGMYVQKGQVFTKIKNGRQRTCTCGENGEEVESSCIGEDDDTPEPAGCEDETSGRMVASGEKFTKRLRGIEHTCTCDDGKASPLSCVRKAVETGPVCIRKGQTYSQGQTYELSARGRRYICTCTQRRGSAVSRCRVP